jgi:hypothetical protein
MRCFALGFAALASGSAIALSLPTPPQVMVDQLIARAVAGEAPEEAFRELEALDTIGVPYLIGRLGDVRLLSVQAITLTNKSPQAFEGTRHYAPRTVHDALSAILNQITGERFEFVYNGASPEIRERNALQWRAWCKGRFPDQRKVCDGAI